MSPGQCVALIATRGRPRLLRERALTSVARQTHAPGEVVVVDDNGGPPMLLDGATVLRTAGGQGASAAWNAGLRSIASRWDPDRTWVAVLDDDDAWCPAYLERCLSVARNGDWDVVAAGLRWLDGTGSPFVPMPSPEQLRAEDFLVTNPGVQGSNLFVRLGKLMTVGGFDEGLPSTTDRDLLIRLIDCGVSYQRIPEFLVEHYAEQDRRRLSTPGSAAKLGGLTGFFDRYRHRMTPQQQAAFMSRAEELFGWSAGAGELGRQTA